MTLQLPPELVAWHDRLTTPQSEDWQVILADKAAHVMALHEDPTPMGRRIVKLALFEAPVAELKKAIIKTTPAGRQRPLGCVTVIVCTDNKWESQTLLDWLVPVARKRNFSVLSVLGTTSTSEAIEMQRGYLDSGQPEALGFTSVDAMAAGHA